jgi:hypothetical protein
MTNKSYAITMSLLRIGGAGSADRREPVRRSSMARLSRELVINFEARSGAY